MQLAGVYARASALFAFTVLVFLILAETPFRVALFATGMIFSQTIAGMALFNSRDRDRKFDLTSSVAISSDKDLVMMRRSSNSRWLVLNGGLSEQLLFST